MNRKTEKIRRTHNMPLGFTLVEVMVAITISMFLIGGLVQIYSSSKKSSLLQQSLASFQESQRFALDLLSRDLRMAGFFNQNKPTNIKPVPKFLVGDDNSKDGGGNTSDSITIKYEADTDCLGHNIEDGDVGYKGSPNGDNMVINTYSILNETLYCEGNAGGGKRALIEGVVNMQVLYGEDLSPFKAGEARTADHYIHIEEADVNDTNFERIKTVRIALLFKTNTPIKTKAESVSYKLLDAPDITVNDKYRREVVVTTIALRN